MIKKCVNTKSIFTYDHVQGKLIETQVVTYREFDEYWDSYLEERKELKEAKQ